MAINSLGHLTDADATLILTCEELYPNGVQLEGFGADGIMSGEDITVAETRMGVDGRLSAGYTPTVKNVVITLEASSPSLEVMQNIWQYMQSTMSQPECTLTVNIPSLNQTAVYTQGCMTKGRPIPDLKTMLDPTQWSFAFAKIKVSTSS